MILNDQNTVHLQHAGLSRPEMLSTDLLLNRSLSILTCAINVSSPFCESPYFKSKSAVEVCLISYISLSKY